MVMTQQGGGGVCGDDSTGGRCVFYGGVGGEEVYGHGVGSGSASQAGGGVPSVGASHALPPLLMPPLVLPLVQVQSACLCPVAPPLVQAQGNPVAPLVVQACPCLQPRACPCLLSRS